MTYDLAVFVGRFQPFHNGHKAVINHALTIADRCLVIIGSAYEPRSLRNPWIFSERKKMILSAYDEAERERIICKPLRDIRYNDVLWATIVQKLVYETVDDPDTSNISLIGRESKQSGYYTSLFPQWDNTAVQHNHDVNGADIRENLFGDSHRGDVYGGDGDSSLAYASLPATLGQSIKAFMTTDPALALIEEYQFIQKYRSGWDKVPFKPTHVTVDAVVVQSGHVLLVERGARPGQGLHALPGGFIHHDEKLEDAMVRKLREETKLKVPAPVIQGSIRKKQVFDAPFRSMRGRTITHAFYVRLRDRESLPKVKGGGEASQCFWWPLGRLDSSLMFEDHYYIIQTMLGIL